MGNSFESEAIKGALPHCKNNPQKCPYDLYSEQLSGSSFTTQRYKNLRTWLFKAVPTCNHSRSTDVSKEFPNFVSNFESNEDSFIITPEQLRWKAFPMPSKDVKVDFIHSVFTYCGCGSPAMKVIYNIIYY